MEHISKTIEQRYNKDATRFYCGDCGVGHKIVGNFGTGNCEGCDAQRLLKEYRWLVEVKKGEDD